MRDELGIPAGSRCINGNRHTCIVMFIILSFTLLLCAGVASPAGKAPNYTGHTYRATLDHGAVWLSGVVEKVQSGPDGVIFTLKGMPNTFETTRETRFGEHVFKRGAWHERETGNGSLVQGQSVEILVQGQGPIVYKVYIKRN